MFVHENITKLLTLVMCLTAIPAIICMCIDFFTGKKFQNRSKLCRKWFLPASRTLVTLASLTFAYAFLEVFLCAIVSL